MLRLTAPVRTLTALSFLALLPGMRRARADMVDTNPLNRQPEVREAFREFHELDYDGALARFQRVKQENPGNPLATAYLLDAVLFRELNRLDLLDTTFYANDGFLTGKHTVAEDPAVRDRITALADEAISEANAELKKNPQDVNALFARGWVKSLEATYSGMVERAFGTGLRQALSARSDCGRVLQLDPGYADARLVVGVYEYVVGALPFAFKVLVGFVGIHGSKSQGMAMLRDDAAHGEVTQVEANTAMMLFLRREGRYGDAVQIARGLTEQYPHDYLFRLEEANLEKDGGEGMAAVATYQHLITQARQPGYYPSAHLELAYYGLGDSLRGQKLYSQAVAAYEDGAFLKTTSPELKRRCLLEAGKTYDLMRNHAKAVQQYEEVMDEGGDTVQGLQARRYMRTAYTGN